MYHKLLLFLITASTLLLALLLALLPALLPALSMLSIADASRESDTSAHWITTLKKATTHTEPDDPPKIEKKHQPQAVKRKSADYRATTDLLLARYPYALMSYLSEVDTILTSDAPEKQIFIIFRLSYLGSRGFHLIADPEAIPEQWQPHFIATREQTVKPGKTSHQIIGKLLIPNSNIKARVFKQVEATSSDIHTEDKIILALSGEKTNEALQCLVRQSKPAHPKIPACSLAIKQLQSIADLAQSFKDRYPFHSLEITGYSFSGAIAQVAISTSESIDQAYIFNSYGIHPSWLAEMSEDRLARIHHSYVEGSFLHGQDDNLLSRFSRWKHSQHKVVVTGMKISSCGLEPHIRQLYKLKHRDSWLDTFYNLATSIWILHSKESVLRAFEAHLHFDFPW